MKNFIIWALSLAGFFYAGAKFYLHSEVSDAMDMAVMMMSPFAEVEYKGVASTMSGELTIEGIWIRPKNYRDDLYIKRLGIDTPSFLSLLEISDFVTLQSKGVPDYFGFIIEGVRVPVEADYYADLYKFSVGEQQADDIDSAAARCTGKYGFSPDTLAALGYREQVFSMSMIARNQENKFSFEIRSGMDEMWDADAHLTLAGDMMTELSKGTAFRPRLSEMQVEYRDRSLKERVNKYCTRLGLSAEQILQAQMDAFGYYGVSNGVEFDDYMLVPYREFLNGKSTILITAKPNEPVAMSHIDLYKPSDVPALLNLEAKTY